MTDREPSKVSESIQHSLANRETIAPSGLEDSTPTGSGPFTALPSQFGRYRVTKLLGRGAMGTVYLAHDPDLGKEVALKVPKFSGDEDPVLLERFRREARAAGDLNHANICGVYEVGQIGPTHFIAMEYIDGRPLSDYISPDLPSRKIAILVRRLALALAQAHDRGIVHRDLKPANIMVNLQGEPVIMDFGLARRLDAAADVRATQSGMIVGSPAYMSPEQARGENGKIGPWTDIYGLGVLFFELLTGSLPFRGPMLSVLGQLATQPPPKPSSLRKDVDPRLESLCLKMLEKKPQNRPASMADVAQSLTEWLKPASTKSEPTISLVEEPVALVPTKPAAPRAEKVDGIEAHKQRVTDLLDKRQYGPALELLEKITNLRDAKFEKLVAWAKPKLKEVRATEQKLREASAPSCNTARQLLKHYDYVGVIQVLEQVPPAYRSLELRDLLEEVTNTRDECDHLQRDIEEAVRTRDTEVLPALVKRLYKLKPNNKAIKQLAADLKQYGVAKVIARRKGQRHFLESNERLFEPKQIVAVVLGLVALFASVYFAVVAYIQTPHGTLVVDVQGEGLEAIVKDGYFVIRDRKQEFRIKTTDKKTIAVQHRGATIDGASREITLKRGEKRTVTVRLVDGQVQLTENAETFTFPVIADQTPPPPIPKPDPIQPKPIPDPVSPGPIKLATAGQELLTLRGHTYEVWSVAFSPDGKRLASASWDRTVKVWDATSGLETLTLKGHTAEVRGVAFSLDGKRLASASHDWTVKVWDATSGLETLTLKGHTGWVTSVAFSPDGQRLVSGSDQGVKVWDATSGQETLTLNGHIGAVRSVALSADGKRLASASDDNTVKVWDATSGQETFTLKGHSAQVRSVAFSADGKLLASASFDQTVKVWDATSGQEARTLKGHTGRVWGVAFSADGKRLASASDDNTVKVWDARSGQETLTLKGHTGLVRSVAFSEDGKRLASASSDQTIKVWDVTPPNE